MCASWILKSGWRLRGAVAAVGVIAAAGGVLLTGDLGRPWQGYSQGFGYALVDVGLGAIVVFVLLDTLLTRQKTIEEEAQKKKEEEIWNPVRDQVNGLVKTELTETLADFILVTNASQVVWVTPGSTPEETHRLQNQAALEELKRLAGNNSALRSNVAAAVQSLPDGQYNLLFLERGRRLGDLQNRYWSRFLPPQHVALLVDLEQLLYRLDTKIAIVKREREAQQNGTLQPIPQMVAKVNDDQLYEILQRILQLLVNGVDKNLVEMS